MANLYGALDQGEEGDIVARSIVCCKGGNPDARAKGWRSANSLTV